MFIDISVHLRDKTIFWEFCTAHGMYWLNPLPIPYTPIFPLRPFSLAISCALFFETHWVHCLDVRRCWIIYWSTSNLPEPHPWRKHTFPPSAAINCKSFLSYWVGLPEAFLHPCWDWGCLLLSMHCACSHSDHVFTCATALSCPANKVSAMYGHYFRLLKNISN